MNGNEKGFAENDFQEDETNRLRRRFVAPGSMKIILIFLAVLVLGDLVFLNYRAWKEESLPVAVLEEPKPRVISPTEPVRREAAAVSSVAEVTPKTVQPAAAEMQIIDAFDSTADALGEAIRSGVTTAVLAPGSKNPIGGQMAAVKLSGRLAGDGQVLGIRVPEIVDRHVDRRLAVANGPDRDVALSNGRIGQQGRAFDRHTETEVHGELALCRHVHPVDVALMPQGELPGLTPAVLAGVALALGDLAVHHGVLPRIQLPESEPHAPSVRREIVDPHAQVLL